MAGAGQTGRAVTGAEVILSTGDAQGPEGSLASWLLARLLTGSFKKGEMRKQ